MSTLWYKVNGGLTRQFQTDLAPEDGYFDLVMEVVKDATEPLQIDIWFSSNTSLTPDRRHEHGGTVQA